MVRLAAALAIMVQKTSQGRAGGSEEAGAKAVWAMLRLEAANRDLVWSPVGDGELVQSRRSPDLGLVWSRQMGMQS
ncbi:hypothetical protein Taro_019260 [Colocasia esculenta]|uniref:Uncharacterized protein n=1 Tax=Colocasia esculenta TaxID=4460 RepID=A0A843UTB9_COLES|nr:hypothetical protein [Colocasia esculenta]